MRGCDYCSETIHHELDMVTDEHEMYYHIWCYEYMTEEEDEQ